MENLALCKSNIPSVSEQSHSNQCRGIKITTPQAQEVLKHCAFQQKIPANPTDFDRRQLFTSHHFLPIVDQLIKLVSLTMS